MKRMLGVLMMALATTVVGASTALAQSTYPPRPSSSVLTTGGASGGSAFTGSDVSLFAVAVVVLLAMGLVALFVARRRTSRASVA